MLRYRSLEALFEKLKCRKLPLLLPVAHVAPAPSFSSIAAAGALKPTWCHKFKGNLLYLFYGGVFYRTGTGPRRDTLKMPVAFVFSPTVLVKASAYYPFDTGALLSGRFGKHWLARLGANIGVYKLSGGRAEAPSSIVCHVYGSNHNYLEGATVGRKASTPEPLASLLEFLSADLTPLGVDKRQCMIECHMSTPLVFDQTLMWVGLPSNIADAFARIYNHTKPWLPEMFVYNPHRVTDPREVCAQLELKSQDVIQRFVDL